MSDAVIFELDLQNPTTLQSLIRCKNMQNGDDISKYLPTTVYARMKQCKLFYMLF